MSELSEKDIALALMKKDQQIKDLEENNKEFSKICRLLIKELDKYTDHYDSDTYHAVENSRISMNRLDVIFCSELDKLNKEHNDLLEP